MKTKKIEMSNDSRAVTGCKHQTLAKEWVLETTFLFGMPSGNYICSQCGLPLSEILRGARK